MDPESKQLLDKTFALAEENNKMLRGMRRLQRISSFMSMLYWLVIIIIALGSFYFMQPYVAQLQKFMKDSGTSIQQLKNLGNLIPKK